MIPVGFSSPSISAPHRIPYSNTSPSPFHHHPHSASLSRLHQSPLPSIPHLSPSFNDAHLQSLCTQGHLDRALEILSNAVSSSPPSTSTYVALLKACMQKKSASGAQFVYGHILSCKVEIDGFLGDYLVMALARCRALEEARIVSASLPHLTVYSWTALISAYAEHGRGQEALEFYRCMLDDGVDPDRYTFVGLFRACASILDLAQGKRLHAEAIHRCVAHDVYVRNSIISMYGKCKAIHDAEEVFRAMPLCDIVTWNAMLSAYVEQERGDNALLLFRQMKNEGLDLNEHTYVIVLKSCCLFAEQEHSVLIDGTSVKPISLAIGEGLHSDAKRMGFVTSDVYVGTAILSTYAKVGTISQTERMFSVLTQRNLISWNAMLSAYVNQGDGEKALQLYVEMLKEGIVPDELTIVFALQACGLLAQEMEDKSVALEIGQALHIDSLIGDFTSDVLLNTTLLDIYSKCSMIMDAEDVFQELSQRTSVSWVAMLAAYVEQGEAEKALQLYAVMHEEDEFTFDRQIFVVALQACTILAQKEKNGKNVNLEIGRAIHADAFYNGYVSDVVIGTAVIRMYCSCGSISEAENAFNRLTQPDLVAWTIMLSAYVEQGNGVNTLHLFGKMQERHLILDEVTVTCVLQACGQTGNLEICRELHFIVVAAGYDSVSSVTATLIHAYGSCGSMKDGQATFDALSTPETVPWTACITAHAIEGTEDGTFCMFERLRLAGLRPDAVTFNSLLSACNHSGYIVRGLKCFDSMSREFDITPGIQHYEIMVDLFARTGNFNMVENILRTLPVNASASIAMSVLGACFQHNNASLAKEAFDIALSLHHKESSPYILMANSYAALDIQ